MNARIIPALALLLAPACVDPLLDEGSDDEAGSTTATADTGETETGDETSVGEAGTEESTETEESGGEVETDCWTVNGFTWCTTIYGDLLVYTPCEGDGVGDSTMWPYECAAGQPIDSTGWDDVWCSGSCWGRRGDVVMSVLPECMIDLLVATPATEWPSGCAEGEPLPMAGAGWEEWRCGDITCAARLGALWVTPMPLCTTDEWLPCEP